MFRHAKTFFSHVACRLEILPTSNLVNIFSLRSLFLFFFSENVACLHKRFFKSFKTLNKMIFFNFEKCIFFQLKTQRLQLYKHLITIKNNYFIFWFMFQLILYQLNQYLIYKFIATTTYFCLKFYYLNLTRKPTLV